MWEDHSFKNHTPEGYPVLQLGYAEISLLGRWKGLSHALCSLREGHPLWIQYDPMVNLSVSETYTILDGEVEFESANERRLLKVGETIDASRYKEIIAFYAKTDAEILFKMTAEAFEPGFFETQVLQAEAHEIEKLDGYTYMHCNRIKDYSLEIWRHLGLGKEKLSILRWGAYFHDIGKREIPLEVLNKPGKLSAEEWELMKTHAEKGAKIMRAHEVALLNEAAYIVEQHHERYDGKGYPKGLKGNEISLEASIVAVVDAFDAMTTDRVYQSALSVDEAIQELIDGKGSQFNPKIVDAFLEVLAARGYRWK